MGQKRRMHRRFRFCLIVKEDARNVNHVAQFTQEICVNLRKMTNGIEVCFLAPMKNSQNVDFSAFSFVKKMRKAKKTLAFLMSLVYNECIDVAQSFANVIHTYV